MEIKSGRYIRRIWNRTVGQGKTLTSDELVELCKKHFFQGKPCIGCPQFGAEKDDREFLISQTPIPRRVCPPSPQINICSEVGFSDGVDSTAILTDASLLFPQIFGIFAEFFNWCGDGNLFLRNHQIW